MVQGLGTERAHGLLSHTRVLTPYVYRDSVCDINCAQHDDFARERPLMRADEWPKERSVHVDGILGVRSSIPFHSSQY